jgi:adenosylcobinamide kinase/adenosylcobinamide-phosphate guanylyltransferase
MAAVDHQRSDGSLILVSGPSRGGKSRWAESLLEHHPRVTYVATSPSRPNDSAWQERLKVHRERRPSHWQLLESGSELGACLASIDPQQSVLIDALGGYVAMHLDLNPSEWTSESEAFVEILRSMPQTRVLVIEETGWGVVPPTRIGGLFRDRLGALAQCLQTQADQSWLVLQGRAINLGELGQLVP